MKKVLTICVGLIFAVGVMAGPPHHHHHHHGHGNSGIRLATDIVNLVGAGLDVLRPPTVVTTGYPNTVVVVPPSPPAAVAVPPPNYTLVPVPGAYDQFGRQIYQRVVQPNNVTYVTMPPDPRNVYVPANPSTTATVIQ